MVRRRLMVVFFCLTCGLALAVSLGLSACSPANNTDSTPPVTIVQQTPPPTPDSELLQVSDTRPAGARLHVTFPSITLLNHDPTRAAQLFLVLADPQGGFSYMLYPANSPGYPTTQFDLRSYPLELSISDDTTQLMIWILAVHNTRYEAAEMLGLDSLIASLGIGFQRWLNEGDPADDPLAAVVSASEGVLYEWFAEIEVIGQSVIMLDAANNWNVDFHSERSPDGGLNSVYTVQYLSESSASPLTTPTPTLPTSTQDDSQFELLVDETFEGGESAYSWYEGGDSTYENTIIDGAYQIHLTDITQREFGLSWGSLEGERFENYVLAAEVSLVEDAVEEAYYGVWFHYQDGQNFIYFGVSNEGEYRVAVVQENKNVLVIRDWTPHSAVNPGAASNMLTVEARADGIFILAINHEQVLTFTDHTYTGGSVAFFCRAKSVPATCRLDRLRIWTRDS
jgi:hypothetical protein